MDWLPSPEYFLNTSDFWVPSLFVITFRKVFRSIRIFGILEYFGPMPVLYPLLKAGGYVLIDCISDCFID